MRSIADLFMPTPQNRTTTQSIRRGWAISDAVSTLSYIANKRDEDPQVRIEAIRKLAEIAKTGRVE